VYRSHDPHAQHVQHAGRDHVAVLTAETGARARLGRLLLLGIPLALTVWIYHPITRVFFFADDLVHLVEIENEGPLVFLLRPFGGNAFLGRNLVFLTTYRLFGPDPTVFQWTVLVTHLLNVWLLFGVLRTLTASATIACFGATLWGVAPLALGSLGWYAAFGHVLVGTTLLLVLRSVTSLAAAGATIPPRAAAWWYALLLVGTTCYGPGIGVALVFPVVLVLLLPAAWRQPAVRWAFLLLPPVTLGLYFGLRWLYTLVGTITFEEIAHSRLALAGFGNAPILLGHFLLYSSAATILAFFMPATHPSPMAWMALAALLAGVALVLWRGSRDTRRDALAMLVLWVGVYLMIAAGRANVLAAFKVPPAVGAATQRYHYAGTIPIVALLCLALQQLGRLPGLRAIPAWVALAVGLALLVRGDPAHRFAIDERPAVRGFYLGAVRDIASAVAAAPPGEIVYVENATTPRYVLGPMLPRRLIPGRATMFLLRDPALRLDGREVRFVERNPDVLAWYRKPERARSPLARLLVAPDEVPGGR
jgi:hypothetical protein